MLEFFVLHRIWTQCHSILYIFVKTCPSLVKYICLMNLRRKNNLPRVVWFVIIPDLKYGTGYGLVKSERLTHPEEIEEPEPTCQWMGWMSVRENLCYREDVWSTGKEIRGYTCTGPLRRRWMSWMKEGMENEHKFK